MSNADLVAAARTFAQGSPLGKNTWRELDKAIVLIRKVADALEAAEAPEWEFGYELIEVGTRDVLTRGWPYATPGEAGEVAARRAEEESDPDDVLLAPEVVRRRKAGPWVPIDKEA